MNKTADKIIPDFFSFLLEIGVMDENNIEKTNDGFYCLNKSISDLLSEKDIHTFLTDDGYELKCENYFDDWYIYALQKENGFVYSLFKLREQEYDMYAGESADYDAPGVTVSFIAYDANTLKKCLCEPTDENRSVMNLLSDSVFFDDKVHVLVASAREVDEDGAASHLLRQFDCVSNRVRAFDCGDDSLGL